MAWKGVVTVVLAVLATGCAQTALETRVNTIELSVARLELTAKKVDAQMEQLGKLSADLEAERAYFKDVKDYVRFMRDDTITLIDDQRKKVEEGRGEYLRILRRQKDLLVTLQYEIEAAMAELEKKPATGGEAIPQPPADPAFKAVVPEPEQDPTTTKSPIPNPEKAGSQPVSPTN